MNFCLVLAAERTFIYLVVAFFLGMNRAGRKDLCGDVNSVGGNI